MKYKILISLICLTVLMFQLLPVKQLGSLLFSNQLQEELPHAAADVEKGMNENPDFKKDFYYIHNITQVNHIACNTNLFIHFATALPFAHVGEIHTPPPNFA